MSIERIEFSERLQQALRNAEYAPDSPTQVAREFNLRFPGRPVTVHATRKWLVGEAIPTQEKLRTLAQWLGVSNEWLRFGGGDAGVSATNAVRQTARDKSRAMEIIERLKQLDEQHRLAIREVIRMLNR
jgi:hypothetical protein